MSHLAPPSSKFQIYINNREQENNTDSPISTAGAFDYTLNANIAPLLFMRSLIAQAAISHFDISNLPLCVSARDTILVTFRCDLDILSLNQNHNRLKTDKKNKVVYSIQLGDVTAREPGVLISYLNHKLNNLNYFLLYRYSTVFYDKQIWKKNLFKEQRSEEDIQLESEEILLLQRYTNITLFSRLIFHNILSESLSDIEKMDPDISYTTVKPPLSSALESRILSKSKIFLSLAERQEASKKHFTSIVNFADFYEVDVAKKQTTIRLEALKKQLREKFVKYLMNMQLKLTGDLTEDDKGPLIRLLHDNLKLIFIGKKISQILSLEYEKLTPDFASGLFKTQLVYLTADPYTSKPVFHLESETYFSKNDSSNMTVTFPPNLSYTLGQSKQTTTLGPLCGNPEYIQTPHTEHSITRTGPSLGGALRHCPKVVRIASNILSSSELHDTWLTETDNSDLNLIHSQILDSSQIEARYITKLDDTRMYYRMLRSSDVLSTIKVKILDENCENLIFPRNTITSIGLCITPFKPDDTY